MNIKERRKDIRIPIIDEYAAITFETQSNKVKIRDISVNGCFVETDILPKPNEVVNAVFRLPNLLGHVIVQAKVKRIRWAQVKKSKTPKGYALEFDFNESKDIEKVMNSYCVYMRNKQIIQVTKRILEEVIAPKV